MANIPKECPSCSHHLIVTELSCPNCGTTVRGTYDPDVFSRLSPNDYNFVVLFLKTKGNIKEMERELGISYWTIRSKLSEIVEQMGLEAAEQPQEIDLSDSRQDILDRLNKGEFSAKEAAEMLSKLKKKR